MERTLEDKPAHSASFIRRLARSPFALYNEESGRLRLRVDKKLSVPDDTVSHELMLVRNQIRELGLPEDISNNPFFNRIVLDELNDDEIEKLKNILPFMPNQIHREGIDKIIKSIADKVISDLLNQIDRENTKLATVCELEIDQAKQAIRNIIATNLGRNLEKCDKSKVIRTDILKPIPKEEKNKRRNISTKKIRDIVNNLRRSFKRGDPKSIEKANIQLLIDMGIYKSFDNAMADRSKIMRNLEIAMGKAWRFYQKIGDTLAESQSDAGIKGEQIRIDPSFIIKAKTPFELLDFCIQDEGNKDPHSFKAYFKYHEAQTIAWLAYLFFMISNNPSYNLAVVLENKFRSSIGMTLFGHDDNMEEAEKIYFDQRGNVLTKEEETDSQTFEKRPTRELKLTHNHNNEEIIFRVWFDDIRTKTESSIIKRLIINPEFDYEEIPDIVAGRLCLMDLKREDFRIEGDNDPNALKKEKLRICLEVIAKKIGNALGLTFRNVDRTKLMPGHFCIKDEIDENVGNPKSHEYYAYKVYGISREGVTFEFQIITRDVFDRLFSRESPTNNKYYNREKDFQVGRTIFRQTTNPRIHEVIDLANAHLRRKKRRKS